MSNLKRLTSVLIGLMIVWALARVQQIHAQTLPDFQGRYIAAISDADMRAYAYIDGQLGEPRGIDQLSLVTLPLPATPALTSSIEVSNSVINPVYSLVASQDGNTIFVAETKEQREPADRLIGDLDLGTTLRAVDISDPTAPRVIAEVDVGIDPQGVSLDASGTTLALATKESADNEQPVAEDSFRVKFPVKYREEFMHYVTVNCSNSHIVRQMYVNLSTVEAIQTSDTVPSGTVLVMETYAAQPGRDDRLTPTQLNNVFVREKRDDWRVNDNSGEWRSAWYSPEGALVSSSQSSCIGCHARVRDRDYLFTLPALLTAVKTNQRQSQETEFGTSVCR